MSQNNMDIALWADGEVRASFWDSVNGEDRHFIIREDMVLEEIVDGDSEGTRAEQVSVDFNKILMEIAFELAEKGRQEVLRMAGLC